MDARSDVPRVRPKAPDLSVVLLTPDCYETIRTTVAHLRAQTILERIELLIVTPAPADLKPVTEELDGFFAVRVVLVDDIGVTGDAKAEAIRVAAAPVVALAEDHAYPDPGWAAALVAAHRNGWVAVGPVVRNANPATLISWADLAIAYGPWLEPHVGGEVDHLPGHNSSYKRDVLIGYGAELGRMLEAETVLQWDLRARGHTLYLEPRARLAHMNFTRPSSWVRVQLLNGRVFGATRAWSGRWGLAHRALFVAGSPFISFVRLHRTVRVLRKSAAMGGQRLRPGLVAILFVGLALDAIGQAVGYALGLGNAKRQLAEFEFHRERHQAPGRNPADGAPAFSQR